MGVFKLNPVKIQYGPRDQLHPEQMHVSSQDGLTIPAGLKFLFSDHVMVTCSSKVTIKAFHTDTDGHFVITDMDGGQHTYDVSSGFSYPKDATSHLVGESRSTSDCSDVE